MRLISIFFGARRTIGECVHIEKKRNINITHGTWSCLEATVGIVGMRSIARVDHTCLLIKHTPAHSCQLRGIGGPRW
jgi:hypothetical protein